jgi:hypothetical protein
MRREYSMPIQKKNLLIPLNNPSSPSLRARILSTILGPALRIVGFVLGNTYKLCFGWLDKRIARRNEQRFAEDIRRYLAFLFLEWGAEIVPNEGTPFPPGFDGAYVTIALKDLRLLFVRGRGDFGVRVASAFAPNHWEEFRLVADGISRWDATQAGAQYYTLETFEPILRSRLGRLQEALSKECFEATLNNAVKVHNAAVDEYASRLRGSGVIPKIY